MSMDENLVEQKLRELGVQAPRLTPELVSETVVKERYWQPEGTTLTVCALELRNGTQVIGHSACVSPENFDEGIGRRIAFDNARQEIWALEGYLLKERLSKEV